MTRLSRSTYFLLAFFVWIATFFVFTDSASANITSNLLQHIDFESPTGSWKWFTDKSGNGRDLYIVGSASSITWAIGKGSQVDANEYLISSGTCVGSYNYSSGYTISFWSTSPWYNGFGRFAYTYFGTKYWNAINYDNTSTLRFQLWNTNTNIYTTWASYFRMYTIVITWTSYSYYINTTLVKTGSTSWILVANSDGCTVLGAEYQYSGSPLIDWETLNNKKFDELRQYNRALTASDVAELYTYNPVVTGACNYTGGYTSFVTGSACVAGTATGVLLDDDLTYSWSCKWAWWWWDTLCSADFRVCGSTIQNLCVASGWSDRLYEYNPLTQKHNWICVPTSWWLEDWFACEDDFDVWLSQCWTLDGTYYASWILPTYTTGGNDYCFPGNIFLTWSITYSTTGKNYYWFCSELYWTWVSRCESKVNEYNTPICWYWNGSRIYSWDFTTWGNSLQYCLNWVFTGYYETYLASYTVTWAKVEDVLSSWNRSCYDSQEDISVDCSAIVRDGVLDITWWLDYSYWGTVPPSIQDSVGLTYLQNKFSFFGTFRNYVKLYLDFSFVEDYSPGPTDWYTSSWLTFGIPSPFNEDTVEEDISIDSAKFFTSSSIVGDYYVRTLPWGQQLKSKLNNFQYFLSYFLPVLLAIFYIASIILLFTIIIWLPVAILVYPLSFLTDKIFALMDEGKGTNLINLAFWIAFAVSLFSIVIVLWWLHMTSLSDFWFSFKSWLYYVFNSIHYFVTYNLLNFKSVVSTVQLSFFWLFISFLLYYISRAST